MCLYFMGLNVSNQQIAQELGLNDDDVHDMASYLREGLVAKVPEATLVAPGFSCRSQVHGLAGLDALHPVELLAAQLEPTGPWPGG